MDFSLDGDSKNHSFYGALTPSIFTFFCRFMATKLQPEKSTLTDLLFFQGFTLLENVLFCIDAYGVKTVWQSSKKQFLENFDYFSSFFVFNATRQFIVGHYERRASAQF